MAGLRVAGARDGHSAMRLLFNIQQGGPGQSMLAGLEAGVVGALCALGYHALGSLLVGEPLWAVPLRLAYAVFGAGVERGGQTAAVAAGVATQVFCAGLLGVIFGLGVRNGWAFRRVLLLGPLLALAWYYLGYEVLLRGLGRGAYLVAGRRSLVLAHLLLGLCLAMYPRFLHGLARGDG